MVHLYVSHSGTWTINVFHLWKQSVWMCPIYAACVTSWDTTYLRLFHIRTPFTASLAQSYMDFTVIIDSSVRRDTNSFCLRHNFETKQSTGHWGRTNWTRYNATSFASQYTTYFLIHVVIFVALTLQVRGDRGSTTRATAYLASEKAVHALVLR